MTSSPARVHQGKAVDLFLFTVLSDSRLRSRIVLIVVVVNKNESAWAQSWIEKCKAIVNWFVQICIDAHKSKGFCPVSLLKGFREITGANLYLFRMVHFLQDQIHTGIGKVLRCGRKAATSIDLLILFVESLECIEQIKAPVGKLTVDMLGKIALVHPKFGDAASYRLRTNFLSDSV